MPISLFVRIVRGGWTDVDDDGDAVGKGKVVAESTLYDIEILNVRLAV
jgi:hypothetical protein